MDPLQLITFDSNGCLKVNNKEKLQDHFKWCHGNPIKVVSVCGPFKSGKSTLLNTWCEKSASFKVGHTTEAATDGIWIHVIDQKQNVILLDVEGWDNSKSKNQDIWLPLIMMMISSEVVINIKNNIDNTCLRNVSYPLEWKVIYSIFYSFKLIFHNQKTCLCCHRNT